MLDLVDAFHAYHSDQVHDFDDLSGIPSEVVRMIRIVMGIRRLIYDLHPASTEAGGGSSHCYS